MGADTSPSQQIPRASAQHSRKCCRRLPLRNVLRMVHRTTVCKTSSGQSKHNSRRSVPVCASRDQRNGGGKAGSATKAKPHQIRLRILANALENYAENTGEHTQPSLCSRPRAVFVKQKKSQDTYTRTLNSASSSPTCPCSISASLLAEIA